MSEVEYHVASYVVLTRPENEKRISEQINLLPGMEVHASENGKLIVTAEAEDTGKLAELTGTLELMDLVLQVAPVYHEFIPALSPVLDSQQDTDQADTADSNEITRSQI
jgi:nitrate reductase NapAB chaperone NapD